MTTSGVTTWSLTALDIVKTAMGEIGALELGLDPDDDEAAECYKRLNGMLKSWQLRGVTLAREQSGTLTTVGGTASGALPASVRNISSARLVVSATMERQLFPMDRATYNQLPNKSAVGTPTMFYFSRGRDQGTFHLWPVPASDATIKLDYDKDVEAVTSGTETVDIRDELQECVYANLALRIAGVFAVQPGPELVARAQALEAQMFDAERPDSYFFWYDDA